MHKSNKNYLYFHIARKSMVFVLSFLFCIFSFASFNFFQGVSAEDIKWSVTLDFSESSGNNDYVVIGEAMDAIDGSPPDDYDMPKSPSPPSPPYIRAWLSDDLSSPYNKLVKDYRFYPDESKVWNLTVEWENTSYSYIPDITVSWDIDQFDDSEYDSVELWNETEKVADMLTESSYTYTQQYLEYPPGSGNYYWIDASFQVICERLNNPPGVPDKPSGETNGYHGVSYSYSTSSIDPEGDEVYYFFKWGDGTDSGWIGPFSSGVLCSSSHSWEDPGTFNISVKAKDAYGAESNWSPKLSVDMGNRPPSEPCNPTPNDKSADIETDIVLSWNGDDPDGDVLTFDIYFGTESLPPKIVSKQSSNSFDPVLDSKTIYYWQIVAWDGYGESTSGPIWSFTTKEYSNGEPGNGDDQNGQQENNPPIADASNSESFGVVNSFLTFDGSRSFDEDGYIKNWSWDFGDGNLGYGEIVSHAYMDTGGYSVTLTVTDDDDATNEDLFLVNIGLANTPPTKPDLSGPTTGNKNVEYTYSVTSIDLDDDFINYIFNWGDGIINTSNFFSNGTQVSLTHSWASAGIYDLVVTASDNQTTSGETRLRVLIDAQMVNGIGYILDIDCDGIFDVFKNDTTLINSSIELKNGDYLIDIDGDNKWDYNYDETTGKTSLYVLDTIVEIPWSVIAMILVALFVILLVIYLFKRGFF